MAPPLGQSLAATKFRYEPDPKNYGRVSQQCKGCVSKKRDKPEFL